MASGLYDSARQSFLTGGINWTGDTIKAAAIDNSDYSVNLAVDDFLDDIPPAAIVATSPALSNKSATAGVADCDDITFSAVSGDTIDAIVIYVDTGTLGTSKLIAYIDAGPTTPNGTNL